MIFKKKRFLLIKMSSKEVISIGKTKRLIDLNKSYTNFKLTFNVVSESQDEFFLAVIDQKSLDEVADSDIEYKPVTGSLSGSVVSDKNIYQNYFLILKSENPMNVTVQIDIEELPKTVQQRPAPNTQQRFNKANSGLGLKSSGWFDSLTINQIIVIVGVIGVLLFLYFKYGKNKTEDSVSEVSISKPLSLGELVPKSSFVPSSPSVSSASSKKSSVSSSSVRSSRSASSSGDEPLIERLKKLNLSKK